MAAKYHVPPGECPGCGKDSHPQLTCDGKTTDKSVAALLELGAVHVPLYPKMVEELDRRHRKGLFE